MKRPDHFAQVAALRQLAGRSLPIHERIAQCCNAIGALHTATRSWPAFAPRLTTLDDMIVQADAVARSLRELRGTYPMPGGPADAA